jgi:hypothetical protein
VNGEKRSPHDPRRRGGLRHVEHTIALRPSRGVGAVESGRARWREAFDLLRRLLDTDCCSTPLPSAPYRPNPSRPAYRRQAPASLAQIPHRQNTSFDYPHRGTACGGCAFGCHGVRCRRGRGACRSTRARESWSTVGAAGECNVEHRHAFPDAMREGSVGWRPTAADTWGGRPELFGYAGRPSRQ